MIINGLKIEFNFSFYILEGIWKYVYLLFSNNTNNDKPTNITTIK